MLHYLWAMMLTPRRFAGFVLVASAIVLGTALASQYWGGLAPCELCLLQRWPWRVAIAIALLALLVGSRPALPWVGLLLAIVFVVSVGLAFYHLGVEQHWFVGPSACTVRAGGVTTLEDMKRQILGTAPVLCDRVQWALFGVSLAGYNAIASALLSVGCFIGSFLLRRKPVP